MQTRDLSVVKSWLIELTRYLATDWADNGVRVSHFARAAFTLRSRTNSSGSCRLLIPLGRMANTNEYQAAIVFLCSDASSYMTGTNLIIDGGRTCW